MVAMVRMIEAVGIPLSLPHYHLHIGKMPAKRRVDTEMDIVLVELIVAVLDEQAIKAASLGIQFVDAIRMTPRNALAQAWLVVEAVEGSLEGIVLNIEREVANMIALVRYDAVEDLHLILLCLFQQKYFGIEVSIVPNAELHVVASQNRALAIIYYRCFAQMTQETIEALCAVPARETVDAQRNLEERKPLAVGALGHIGLQFVRPHLLVLAADACSRKQIAVLGNETRGVASAQKQEENQQKKGFYLSFKDIHATKATKQRRKLFMHLDECSLHYDLFAAYDIEPLLWSRTPASIKVVYELLTQIFS